MYRLFGVALLVVLVAAGCPEQCRCPETTGNLVFEVSCKNASLTEVPTGPLQEVFFVDLSFNNITILKNNAFFDKQMVKLLRLYLNNNGLKTIEENAFRGLTHLKLLNLEQNDISELLPNVFRENTKLEVLNLSGNKHLLLPDSGLNLPILSILLLKGCGLETIPTQFFKNMLSLEHIFLNVNKLKVFDPELILPLSKLEELDLRNNNFTSLPFDLHEHLPERLVVDFNGNDLHCDCGLDSTYSLNKEKKVYNILTCGTPTTVPLDKFLLERCTETTVAGSLVGRTSALPSNIANISLTSPTSPLEMSWSTSTHETTSQSSSLQVIAPEDEDEPNGSSDRTDVILAMDGYTGWIVLSAVVLALIIVAAITVFVKRRNKTRDYVTPRRFTLLEYDDEEQSYVT